MVGTVSIMSLTGVRIQTQLKVSEGSGVALTSMIKFDKIARSLRTPSVYTPRAEAQLLRCVASRM